MSAFYIGDDDSDASGSVSGPTSCRLHSVVKSRSNSIKSRLKSVRRSFRQSSKSNNSTPGRHSIPDLEEKVTYRALVSKSKSYRRKQLEMCASYLKQVDMSSNSSLNKSRDSLINDKLNNNAKAMDLEEFFESKTSSRTSTIRRASVMLQEKIRLIRQNSKRKSVAAQPKDKVDEWAQLVIKSGEILEEILARRPAGELNNSSSKIVKFNLHLNEHYNRINSGRSLSTNDVIGDATGTRFKFCKLNLSLQDLRHLLPTKLAKTSQSMRLNLIGFRRRSMGKKVWTSNNIEGKLSNYRRKMELIKHEHISEDDQQVSVKSFDQLINGCVINKVSYVKCLTAKQIAVEVTRIQRDLFMQLTAQELCFYLFKHHEANEDNCPQLFALINYERRFVPLIITSILSCEETYGNYVIEHPIA